MESRANTIKYGIYTFASVAVYFLLMKLFGLEHVTWLRFGNLAIIIYFTNQLQKRNMKNLVELQFVESMASLFLANVINVALSIAAFTFYVRLIDTEFLNHFTSGILWSGKLDIWKAVASLILEGTAGAVLISYITMQYWADVKKVAH